MASPSREVDINAIVKDDDNVVSVSDIANRELGVADKDSNVGAATMTTIEFADHADSLDKIKSIAEANHKSIVTSDSDEDAENDIKDDCKVTQLGDNIASGIDNNAGTAANPGFLTADGETPAEGYSLSDCSSSSPAETENSMEATDGGDKQSSSAKTYRVISFHEKGGTYIQVRDENGHAFLRVHKNLVSAISTAWSDKMKDSHAVIIAQDKAEKHDCRHVLKMLDQDDDPIGLIILFQLAHWKFHDLTDRLTIDELWALARTSHKTECTFLVTPYAERWIVNGLHYQMTVNGASNDEEKIMVIAWVFGEARAFVKVLPQVVTNTSLSADGEVLLDRHDNPWATHSIPSELIDMMKAIRLKRLTKVMKTVDGPIHDMLEANNDFMYCRAKDSLDIKEACQSQQLGSLMSGLVKVGLLPFPDPHKYIGTIASIAEKLEDIKAVRYKVPGALPHNDTHIACGAKHKEKIRAIKEEPIRLTRSLAAALKRRGLTTGAFRHELFSEVQVSEGEFVVDENPFELTKSPILSTQAWIQEFTANEDSEEE